MRGMIFRLIVVVFVCFLTALARPAYSSESVEELKAQIKVLMEQNKALTQRLKRVEDALEAIKRGEAHGPRAEVEEATEESPKPPSGFLTEAEKRIKLSGLLEFGGAYRNTSFNDEGDKDESDLAMTTVELDFSAKLNSWVDVTGVLLYEDPTFTSDENSLDVDSASVVFGNDQTPFTLTMGKVYVPFGALFTHFPDDPFIDSPITLLLGETNEKAAILEYSNGGLFVSAYAFNGDVEEIGEDENTIESYGFDINFKYGFDLSQLNFYKRGEKFQHNPLTCIDFIVGASYISNLADSDYVSDMIGDVVDDYVGGVDFYLHMEHCGYFIDAEFMGATERFSSSILSSGHSGARPYVWNFEAGFNYNWWKNLEVALKIAGSHDTEGLALPENRFGINLNQTLCEGVNLSVGYIHDEYHTNDIEGRDDRDLVYGQMAVEF